MNTIPEEKLRRLTPEKRALYEERLRKVKRNRRILAGVVVFIIAALIGVVLSLTVLFKITSVNVVKPGKIYGTQDIINASGLEIGDNILTTKFDDAEQRIEKILPYVLDAKISKNILGKVNITVTDDKAEVIFAANNGYALADVNGKVLEVLKEKPENCKYKVLKTKKKANAVPGEEFKFINDAEKTLFNKICEALKKAGIFDDVTAIDFSEVTNIKIVYKDRLRIKVGNIDDIDRKLQSAIRVIADEDAENPNGIAEINAKNPDKVFVKSLDTLEEKTDNGETKDKPSEETTSQAEDATSENENGEDGTSADESESEDGGENETEDDSSSENETNESDENEDSEDENDSGEQDSSEEEN